MIPFNWYLDYDEKLCWSKCTTGAFCHCCEGEADLTPSYPTYTILLFFPDLIRSYLLLFDRNIEHNTIKQKQSMIIQEYFLLGKFSMKLIQRP